VVTGRPITAPTGAFRSKQQQPVITPTLLSGRESSRRAASAGGNTLGAIQLSLQGNSTTDSRCIPGTDDTGSCSAAQPCSKPVADNGSLQHMVPDTAAAAHLAVQQAGTVAAATATSAFQPEQPAGVQPPAAMDSHMPASASCADVAASSYRSSSNQAPASGLHGSASVSSRLVPCPAQLPPLTCSRAAGAGPTSRVAQGKPNGQATGSSSSSGPGHQPLLTRLLTRDAGIMGNSIGGGSSSPLSVAGLQARATGKLQPAAAGGTPRAAGPGGAVRRSSGGCDVLPYTDCGGGSSVELRKQGTPFPLSVTMADVRVRRFPSFHRLV
jgi:hypothetical protein